MKTLAIVNRKGGVAKTTTAHNIGAGLKLKGYSVLYIDLDPQGNLSYSFGINPNEMHTALSVISGNSPADDCIHTTDCGDIIPATTMLSNIDSFLSDVLEMARPYQLKKALEKMDAVYDFCIIDTPPSLDILTINALTSANEIVVPCMADVYSLAGIGQLAETVNTVREIANPNLKINGLLLTRHNPRSVISREMTSLLSDTATMLSTKVYNTFIRECTALRESSAYKQDIFTYAPKSNASTDYMNFVNEFLEEE